MIGQTISNYKILEKLGEGGMGVVYKAEDTKLDRIVALKFLPHHLTSSEAEQSRFLQEAKAAAALNHPNVCSVIDIQEANGPAFAGAPAGGQQFIVMEYVDGVTLRKKAPVAKLDEAIGYAIHIGEALQAAHAKGIVHRDVKSENVMVTTDGRVKVMDFGLAKLKGSLKMTKTSSTVGTLAYMAPEQIQGGDVDARSDIFSFGVVLFEMLTGKLPFRGEHDAAIMYSILNEEPESIQKAIPDISTEIDRIIRRALEKDPADRYQHIDDMVSELRRLQKQSGRIVRPESSRPRFTSSPGPNPSSKTMLWIGIGGVVVLAVVAALIFRSGPSQKMEQPSARKMLVVLPFENLGAPDQEYFADGITEEITSKLSGLSGLGVIARSSAMQYKKATKPIKQIGEELGVSFALQGTVRWETSEGATRVRVTPQLINIADGTQMWSQPSEAVFASAFRLQSEIAGQVANALDITLLQPEKHSLETVPTNNAEAYDSYLRGNEYLYRSTTEEDFHIAEQMFQRAVDLDPNFAKAFAKLGFLHSNFYWEYYDHTADRVRKSKATAEQALHIAPDLSDAHGAMGWYYYHCLRDFKKGRQEFQRGLNTDPNNMDLLLGIASVDRRQGNFTEAITYYEQIANIDPRSPSMIQDLAVTYLFARRFAEAEKTFDRVINLVPDVAEAYYSKAYLYLMWRGDIPSARRTLEDAIDRKAGRDDAIFLYYTIIVDVLDGKFSQALARLESSELRVFAQQEWYIPRELLLAEIHGYLKQPEKQRAQFNAARVILEKELRNKPDDPRVHSSLGICFAGLGREDDAIREGKRAIELIPLSVEALNTPVWMQNLALIYTMVGKGDAAIDALEELVKISSRISVPLIRLDPAWNPLRSNPRFQKLIAEKK
jgi:serine/threonine protein kinase/Flp pilus assembly protein TadD